MADADGRLAGPGASTIRTSLTDYLTKLDVQDPLGQRRRCHGLARRAKTEGFRGNMVLLYDRLPHGRLPGVKTIVARRDARFRRRRRPTAPYN